MKQTSMLFFALFIFSIMLISTGGASAQIKIKAVGDVMLGSYTPSVRIPSDSGRAIVNNVSGYFCYSDVVYGNLEGVFIEPGLKPCKCTKITREKNQCFEFGMPKYLAPKLKEIGFTLLGMDNNHIGDYGKEVYDSSASLVRSLGMNVATQKGQAVFNVRGKKVACAAFGFSRGSGRIDNLPMVTEKIQALKKDADIVIVAFHGGSEGATAQLIPEGTEMFLWEKRGDVKAFAKTAIDAGADIVLGSGPHVLRGMELYKGKLIAYSLGNFISYGHFNLAGPCGISAILEAELDEKTGNFIKGKIIPFYQTNPGTPHFDEKGRAIESLKKLSEGFPDNKLAIDKDGGISIR